MQRPAADTVAAATTTTGAGSDTTATTAPSVGGVGSSATSGGGSFAAGTVPGVGSSVSTSTAEPRRTRLQLGIRKPKVYTDGTIRYGCITSSEEPRDVDEALSNHNWKHVMDLEYNAL
jgi:hypothetical protein